MNWETLLYFISQQQYVANQAFTDMKMLQNIAINDWVREIKLQKVCIRVCSLTRSVRTQGLLQEKDVKQLIRVEFINSENVY